MHYFSDLCRCLSDCADQTALRQRLIRVLCGLGNSLWNNHYCNNPKYWDRQTRANIVDPDQMRHLIRVYTVCHSSSSFYTHQQVVKWTRTNFRTSMINMVRSYVPIIKFNMVILKTLLNLELNAICNH